MEIDWFSDNLGEDYMVWRRVGVQIGAFLPEEADPKGDYVAKLFPLADSRAKFDQVMDLLPDFPQRGRRQSAT